MYKGRMPQTSDFIARRGARRGNAVTSGSRQRLRGVAARRPALDSGCCFANGRQVRMRVQKAHGFLGGRHCPECGGSRPCQLFMALVVGIARNQSMPSDIPSEASTHPFIDGSDHDRQSRPDAHNTRTTSRDSFRPNAAADAAPPRTTTAITRPWGLRAAPCANEARCRRRCIVAHVHGVPRRRLHSKAPQSSPRSSSRRRIGPGAACAPRPRPPSRGGSAHPTSLLARGPLPQRLRGLHSFAGGPCSPHMHSHRVAWALRWFGRSGPCWRAAPRRRSVALAARAHAGANRSGAHARK